MNVSADGGPASWPDPSCFHAALVASCEAAIIGLTLDGVIVSWNAAAEKLYGYAPAEAVGRDLTFMTPASRVGELPDILARLAEGEAIDGFRTERVRKDGTILQVAVTWSLVRDAAGAILGASAVHRDISDEVRAMRALQASEARFRGVVATAGEGVVLANQQGEIILWNPEASRLFGYDPSEALGRPLTMLMPERFRQAHRRGLAAAARLGPPVHRKPMEVVALHKHGGEFPIELAITTWESYGERYFTGLVRDISERRALEQMKNTFIAMVSHEMRTPLTTITCAIELLTSGALAPHSAKAARMLEIALSNTRHLARIVDDILDLEVLEQGPVSIVRAPCDVRAVVLDAVQTTAPLAERREVAIEPALSLPPGFSLSADADRLQQTIVNLVVNAIRYAPPGSRIVVAGHLTGGELRLSVDDEGPGIPLYQRELVFERFYRGAAPSGGPASGTGLGLPFCRAIVQQHGGRIWVEDGPRGGAAIVLVLPIHP